MTDLHSASEYQETSEDSAHLAHHLSFEDIVRQNVVWMLGVAQRILNDKSLAEDAVQTTFAKIHKKLHTFEERSSLKTWMYKCVVNDALMILRKRDSRKEGSIETLLPEFDENGCRIEDPYRVVQTAEGAVYSRQVSELVNAKINELPLDYRVVLVLRDIEDLNTAEVAKTLEISQANVKVRLHRARSALKKLLEPMMRRGEL
ncbi:sigma-70 family RNA polymerase sigma factor [Ruegeria sp. SCPT10]|uniref:RNA polymerase sigma factor n=1 Tax=Ruegeria sp. SCP10 TaxID=3141377 RepID=UPI003339A83A